jgi:hypothetical protein
MQEQQLEKVAQWTPLFIFVYFALHFLIRIVASGNLETDEAQFVGATHLALGYGNSHPPLYNWLVAGALKLTGDHWPSALALIKTILLIGTYWLAFDTMRRATGRALPGLIVAASFLFIPQIVWKSQITLAHSVMVMFGVVATLHAVIAIVEQQKLGRYIWLGIAITIGMMAKYNFLLMLVAIFAAALSIRQFRARILCPKLALSFLIPVLSIAPHLVWAVQHIEGTTGRMAKLARENTLFGMIDLPGIGIDGFLSALLGCATWAGLLLIVWFVTRYLRGGNSVAAHDQTGVGIYTRFFGRTTAIGLVIFCIIILAGDFTSVHERYLTPILIVLPFWLALRFPLDGQGDAPVHFLRTGAAIAILMVTAWPAWMAFGKEQFAYPYSAFAGDLQRFAGENTALIADRDKYAANLVIRLDFARSWRPDETANRVIIVWSSRRETPPDGLVDQLPAGFSPIGEPLTMTHDYDNFSGIETQLKAQLYARNS